MGSGEHSSLLRATVFSGELPLALSPDQLLFEAGLLAARLRRPGSDTLAGMSSEEDVGSPTNGSSHESPGQMSRHSELWERRQHDIEAYRKSKEAEYTFQPTITPNPKYSPPSRPLYPGREVKEGEPAPLTPREQVMLRKELEAKREQENFSFQPKLFEYHSPKGAAKSSSEGSEAGSETKFDKLYRDAQARKDFLRSYAEKTTPSFTPTLHTRSASRERAPPSSVEKLYSAPGAGRAREDAAKKAGPTFQPKITPRASAVERDKEATPSKLYESAKLLSEKRRELAEKRAAELTFSPKLYSSETKRAASAGRYGENKDIAARSAAFLEIRRQHLENIKAEKEQREASTFEPSIAPRAYVPPPSSSKTAERRRSILKGTETFTFQPTINASSSPVIESLLFQ